MPRKSKPTKKTFKPRKMVRKGKRPTSAVTFTAKAPNEILATTRSTGARMMVPQIWGMSDGKLPARVLIRQAIGDMNLSRAPAAVRDKYTFSLNSCFNFDKTGATAIQPNLYDTLATLYTTYKVSHVKFNVNLKNTTNASVMFGLMASDADLVSALSLDVLRQRSHKSIILNPSGSNGDRATLSASINLRKLIGNAYEDSEYTGIVGANPANIAYLHLVSASTDEATNITYRLGYDAVLSVEYKISKDERALD